MYGLLFIRGVLLVALAAAPGIPHMSSGGGHHSRGNSAAARQRAQQAQKQNMIKAAEQQLAAGKELLAAAEAKGSSAKSKLDSALAKMKDSSKEFHDAQSTSRKLAKELIEIEQDLIDEQKQDSPYGKASGQLDASRSKLREVEEKIMAEQSVQTELAGLSGVKLAERTRAILALRPDYLEVKSNFDSAASEVSRIRTELFRNNKDWKETSQALTDAHKEEKQAELKTHEGVTARRGAPETIRDADQAKEMAQAMIKQAEAVLKSAGVKAQPGQANKAKPKFNN